MSVWSKEKKKKDYNSHYTSSIFCRQSGKGVFWREIWRTRFVEVSEEFWQEKARRCWLENKAEKEKDIATQSEVEAAAFILTMGWHRVEKGQMSCLKEKRESHISPECHGQKATGPGKQTNKQTNSKTSLLTEFFQLGKSTFVSIEKTNLQSKKSKCQHGWSGKTTYQTMCQLDLRGQREASVEDNAQIVNLDDRWGDRLLIDLMRKSNWEGFCRRDQCFSDVGLTYFNILHRSRLRF